MGRKTYLCGRLVPPRTIRGMRRTFFPALVLVAVASAASASVGGSWQRAAPVPVARTEVAAGLLGREVVVAGGFLASGGSSRRVDAFSPRRNRWRRLPDLPFAVNHAMAASWRGRLYVVGGHRPERGPSASAFVFSRGAWRPLPPLPEPRAAGGAAVVAGRLYVVGGVGPRGLARAAFVLDLRRRRWATVRGPTPREHLAVTAARGRVYAVAGRTAGLDTNLATFEVYSPRARSWRRLPPVPGPRGGTAAAAIAGRIVSVGGEEPRGTIASVYAFDLARGRWQRLPDLPTPRHGLGAVSLGGRVYAVAGGPRPGLHVSGANEFLRFGR